MSRFVRTCLVLFGWKASLTRKRRPQTNDSDVNVRHFSEDDNIQSILHVGDLSYADSQMMRWESWGRMVEPVAARTPWMVAAGNHEIESDKRETLPMGDHSEFNTYQHRYRMPAPESSHGLPMQGNFWYSYDIAGAHVVVLNSYANTSVGSPQYRWLEADLKLIDRSTTPWVIAGSHCPWYNSNTAHHNEPQTLSMKAAMEPLFASHGVDIAFAGHVHAYERCFRTLNNKTAAVDAPGTVYINIGWPQHTCPPSPPMLSRAAPAPETDPPPRRPNARIR
eukprot:SAG31_NODE_4042_length_3642_cov_2.065481_1_plen_279_part_00